MLRRLSLVIIAAAVTAVTAAAATTLSLRSDQRLGNVTELSLVEQSINAEAKPSDWIALPLCAVSVVFILLFAGAYLAHIAPLYCPKITFSKVTQANLGVYNSIAQLRYYRLFQARYILHLQECRPVTSCFILPRIIMQLL